MRTSKDSAANEESESRHELINWSHRGISSSSTQFYLSPIRLYQISKQGGITGNLKQQNCDEQMCTLSKTLRWIGFGVCHFNFACIQLDGNACGDFGIVVSSQGDETNICHKNQVFEKTLNVFDEVLVSLWHNQEAVFNVNCNAWCTPQGQLPLQEFNSVTMLEDRIFVQLKAHTAFEFNAIPIKAEMDGHAIAMSPLMVYTMRLDQTTVELMKDVTCLREKCSFTTSMHWLGKEASTFNFACSNLVGNSCGSFGILLSDQDNTKQLCHNRQVLTMNLNMLDKVNISLWFAKDTEFEVECYAWCTASGIVPNNDLPEHGLLESDTKQALENSHHVKLLLLILR